MTFRWGKVGKNFGGRWPGIAWNAKAIFQDRYMKISPVALVDIAYVTTKYIALGPIE